MGHNAFTLSMQEVGHGAENSARVPSVSGPVGAVHVPSPQATQITEEKYFLLMSLIYLSGLFYFIWTILPHPCEAISPDRK